LKTVSLLSLARALFVENNGNGQYSRRSSVWDFRSCSATAVISQWRLIMLETTIRLYEGEQLNVADNNNNSYTIFVSTQDEDENEVMEEED
jgi:hypothetical protein